MQVRQVERVALIGTEYGHLRDGVGHQWRCAHNMFGVDGARRGAVRSGDGARIEPVEFVDALENLFGQSDVGGADIGFELVHGGRADDDRGHEGAGEAEGERHLAGVETVLGVPGVMLIGRSLADLTPPENRNEVAAAWEAFLASGHQEGSIELLRPDGRRVHVDFRARANTPEPGVHASILARAGAGPVPPPPFEEVIAAAFGSETPVSPASS